MKATGIGEQALTGWRRKVGEPVAQQLSGRTRLSPDDARAIIGGAFFLVSLWYVLKTLVSAARADRA